MIIINVTKNRSTMVIPSPHYHHTLYPTISKDLQIVVTLVHLFLYEIKVADSASCTHTLSTDMNIHDEKFSARK